MEASDSSEALILYLTIRRHVTGNTNPQIPFVRTYLDIKSYERRGGAENRSECPYYIERRC
jgi:hypothetical protein